MWYKKCALLQIFCSCSWHLCNLVTTGRCEMSSCVQNLSLTASLSRWLRSVEATRGVFLAHLPPQSLHYQPHSPKCWTMAGILKIYSFFLWQCSWKILMFYFLICKFWFLILIIGFRTIHIFSHITLLIFQIHFLKTTSFSFSFSSRIWVNTTINESFSCKSYPQTTTQSCSLFLWTLSVECSQQAV